MISGGPEITVEFFVPKSKLDRIALHPICKANNVTMETFFDETAADRKSEKKSFEVLTFQNFSAQA